MDQNTSALTDIPQYTVWCFFCVKHYTVSVKLYYYLYDFAFL